MKENKLDNNIIEDLKASIDRTMSQNGISDSFPVEVFPTIVKDIITATNKDLNYPIDFIGASILYAVSVAIGNSHKVEIKKGWIESAVIYLAIVAMRGTNKSAPLSFAMKPFDAIDELEYKKYSEELKRYEKVSKLTKSEREGQGLEETSKPTWNQILATDFTIESLNKILQFNRRGIGVYSDELASWMNNFTRYNKGSEEQYWLSNWSGKAQRVNRSSNDPIFIRDPFISVAGTTQPDVLNDLFKGKVENGFLDRLLLVYVKDIKKEYWGDMEIDQAHIDNWKIIIDNILKIPLNFDDNNNLDPIILKPSPEAKKILYKWNEETTDISNSTNDKIVKSVYAKMEMYVLRLSLILELMRWACGESDRSNISIESANSAILLCDYFFKSAINVHEIVLSDDPLKNLSSLQQNIYYELPDLFKTGEGVKIADKLGLKERAFKNFIYKKTLFRKIKDGYYEKLL